MKKVLFWGGLCLTLLFAACSKNNDNPPAFDHYAQFVIDSTKIEAYLKSNNITAIKDSTGVFYRILEPGTGTAELKPTAMPTVRYRGTLLNGTEFDKSDSTNFGFRYMLRDLIPAWQIALPKVKKGGKIQIFTPSYFAYRNIDQGKIPANSVLIFDITLLDFTDPK